MIKRNIITLSNGYRLSLITGDGAYYCSEGTYEVALLKMNDQGGFDVCYDFFDDVWAHQTPQEVLELIKKVSELK